MLTCASLRLFGLARGFAALGFQFAVDLVDQRIDALLVGLQLAQLLALLLESDWTAG